MKAGRGARAGADAAGAAQTAQASREFRFLGGLALLQHKNPPRSKLCEIIHLADQNLGSRCLRGRRATPSTSCCSSPRSPPPPTSCPSWGWCALLHSSVAARAVAGVARSLSHGPLACQVLLLVDVITDVIDLAGESLVASLVGQPPQINELSAKKARNETDW